MYIGIRGSREGELSGDESAASLLYSVRQQEAQYEKLSRELEMERQSVARQLEKCKANSDAASISSVSDTDDSFIWRAHAGSGIDDSDNESQHSTALMDSCLKVLEGRGVMNPGDDITGQPGYTESTTTSKVVSGNRVTKTTKTVVKSSTYRNVNGEDEEVTVNIPYGKGYIANHQRGNSMSSTTSSLRNGIPNDRTPVARSASNASSVISAKGAVDPNANGYSNVTTTVLPDGSLMTTYTSKTTTVHEEPAEVTREYRLRSSPSPSSPHMSPYASESEGHAGYMMKKYTSSQRSNYTSSTLPRQTIEPEINAQPTPPRSATLPRLVDNYRPVASSTPESQIHEEERINPDGSRVYVRKVVTTTTTTTTSPDDEFIEVTIAPEVEGSPGNQEFLRREIDDTADGRFERMSTSSFRSDRSDRSQRGTTPRQHYPPASAGVGYGRMTENRTVEERTTTKTSSLLRTGETERTVNERRSRTPSQSTDVEANERITRAAYERSSNRSMEAKPPPMPRPYDDATDVFTDETVIRAQHINESHQAPVVIADSKNAHAGGYIVEETVTTKKTICVDEEEDDEIKKRPPSYGAYQGEMEHGYEIDLLDLLMFLKTDDDILKANAAGYIMHLCYNDEAIKIKMRELDLIPLLVRLLDHESEDCHRNAAGALKNLSYGRFLDDNKTAIQECGGIPACVRLLYRTNSLEVREHVSGILYNLSSSLHIKAEILDDAVEAVSVLIVIPLSGWDRQTYLEGRPPNMVIWSVLLRNATGVLRNVSSVGTDARQQLRQQEGLVDALVWMLRAAIAQDKNDIDNKIVENTMCILRNISYKLDTEVNRDVYPDAVKILAKPEEEPRVEFRPLGKRKQPDSKPQDASTTGCLFMKKKPPGSQRRKLSAKKNNSSKPEELVEQYREPERTEPILGAELLWDAETVSLYIYLIDKSNNSLTLEAACGAVHNLCAGHWNWAALIRAHVRRGKGLPPLAELLTVEQEFIVRAAAFALRNLSVDKRNRELIGRFAIKELLAVIPPPETPHDSIDPSDHTITAVLGAIAVVVHGHLENCQHLKTNGGIPKIIALTREEDPKKEKPLRIYSQRVVLEANRVLLYAWEYKEVQTVIKKGFWSHSKAVETERAYKNATLKQPKKEGDSFAEIDEESTEATLQRDTRRYVTVPEGQPERRSSIEKPPPSPSTPTFPESPRTEKDPKGETLELKNVHRPPDYADDEEAHITEEKPLMGKQKKESDTEADERTPLYAKVEKKKKANGKAENGKADSWV